MRKLKAKEMKKRGCIYCKDHQRKWGARRQLNYICPHAECPYHELDKYKSYSAYMKSKENDDIVKILSESAK